MYIRHLASEIFQQIDFYPVVAILGPHQIGKTALALEVSKNHSPVYIDLQDLDDFLKLNRSTYFLEHLAEKTVILDGVERYPDLFTKLRDVIYSRRREGRGSGRFFILGSRSIEFIKQNPDSLTELIHYCELSGLSPFEIKQPQGQSLQDLWLRGGFPASYAAADDKESYRLRQQIIRTYIDHDIPQLGPRMPPDMLLRFWTMLAHTQGGLLNASKLAESLDVRSVTISRYLQFMIGLFLIRRLDSYTGVNVNKRLVKSPKIYIRDSGIVHALLQITDYPSLLSHPISGKSWEGFVVENILNALPSGVKPYFYRTAVGAEIDLLLEFGPDEFWAIDIKSGRTAALKKGFHLACADLNVKTKFVVYTGESLLQLDDDTTVLPLSQLLGILNEKFKEFSY